MYKIAFFLIAALLSTVAVAQDRNGGAPKGTKSPDIIQKIGTDIQNKINNPEQPVTNAPCDFNIFSSLQAKNLLDQVKICITQRGQDDVQAALDSATAAKDSLGIQCLTPALAIVKAAANVSVAQSAAHADTTSATAVNPTTPNPQVPGPILIFQKFREFVIAGGPTSCKSWVQTTISGANPLNQ